ncbi:hypothetical protein NQ315_001247 [Exocentrus adspersus]|uniref:MD-2-related lipid-recognition domain-containing protein n=1 Tax=Exocentrus adspersus TaxID=1586481 RepID=A0AAV8WED0_9CUCU|nr:hypothetical protein NQ315_001247 [Exocentrus adspersus]
MVRVTSAAVTIFCVLTPSLAFTVDVVNVTRCPGTQNETGELVWDIGSEETVDQLFTGTFNVPVELNVNAYVDFESYYWDEEVDKWIFVFGGIRSFCNSVMKSLPYRKFRTAVRPDWPEDCPVPAGKYELEEFPISGQYAVLSDIRDVPPLVRHELRLWGEDDLIFCRTVYTISSN